MDLRRGGEKDGGAVIKGGGGVDTPMHTMFIGYSCGGFPSRTTQSRLLQKKSKFLGSNI